LLNDLYLGNWKLIPSKSNQLFFSPTKIFIKSKKTVAAKHSWRVLSEYFSLIHYLPKNSHILPLSSPISPPCLPACLGVGLMITSGWRFRSFIQAYFSLMSLWSCLNEGFVTSSKPVLALTTDNHKILLFFCQYILLQWSKSLETIFIRHFRPMCIECVWFKQRYFIPYIHISVVLI